MILRLKRFFCGINVGDAVRGIEVPPRAGGCPVLVGNDDEGGLKSLCEN
jgi:hypothetical protein